MAANTVVRARIDSKINDEAFNILAATGQRQLHDGSEI
jgi:antitoxin component of RelBE/YafQ-DinJ toxin-antitoxin module